MTESSLQQLASSMPVADFVCLDTETANQHRSSLCAVGVTAVRDGLVVGEGLEVVDPECEFSDFNTLVHGLDAELVGGCRTLPEVWQDLAAICNGQLLVCHNASFDVSVLRTSAARYELPGFDADVMCSMRLARRVWPDVASYGLPYLAAAIGLEFDHHNALADSRACAEVTIVLLRSVGAASLMHLTEEAGLHPGRLTADSFVPIRADYSGQHSSLKNREADPDASPDAPLFDTTVCFTGTLISMVRSDAAELVVTSGGSFKNNMSKKVGLLVLGDADYLEFADGHRTGKLQKAVELREKGEGPEVVRESDFFRMLSG